MKNYGLFIIFMFMCSVSWAGFIPGGGGGGVGDFLADGTVPMTGTLDMGTNAISNVTTITATGDIITTSTVQGLIDVTTDTSATIVLTAADCDGAIRVNGDDDAIDYTLPNAANGLNCLFYTPPSSVVTIDTFDGNESIMLNGTQLAAGNAIDSSGNVGDFILLVASGETVWASLGRSGTWVDGGSD